MAFAVKFFAHEFLPNFWQFGFDISPKTEVEVEVNVVKAARCAVPTYPEGAEQTVHDFTRGHVRAVA